MVPTTQHHLKDPKQSHSIAFHTRLGTAHMGSHPCAFRALQSFSKKNLIEVTWGRPGAVYPKSVVGLRSGFCSSHRSCSSFNLNTQCLLGAGSRHSEALSWWSMSDFQWREIVMRQHSKTFSIFVCFQLCSNDLVNMDMNHSFYDLCSFNMNTFDCSRINMTPFLIPWLSTHNKPIKLIKVL